MKNRKVKFFVMISLLLPVACTRNFEEINKNPNRLNFGEIKACNCFEQLIHVMGRKNQENAFFWCNELVQFTAYTQGAVRQQHNYQVTDGHWQSLWDGYARAASDCEHMIFLAKKTGDKYYEALGLILKVQNLSNLSAMTGDIPYGEAFKYKANLTPEFESQEEVLCDCIRDLDSANVILSRNPDVIDGGLDPVYSDNANAWRKFANSLKIRLLCRGSSIMASEKGEAYYWGEIQRIHDDAKSWPVFESNEDNAAVGFKEVDPYKSQFGVQKYSAADVENYRTTQQVIKMMTVLDEDGNALLEDPRLRVFSTQKNGKWIGTMAGCTSTEQSAVEMLHPAVQNFSTLAGADMPAFLMDYSEILFIYAEGALKGKLQLNCSVKELYEAAVRASIEKWSPFAAKNKVARPIREKDVDLFLASEIGSFDGAAANENPETAGEGSIYGSAEELLLSQKWLSLYYVGLEAYHEWRRNEYPVLTIGNGTQYNNYELPSRFGYPPYTVSTNSEHVTAALQRMGGENDMHTPLDWSFKKRNGGKNRNPHPNAQ